MLQTEQDVFDRVQTRIGKLARKHNVTHLVPSDYDTDALGQYLSDGMQTICSEGERLKTSITIDTVKGQAYVQKPPYVYLILQASVRDGSTAYELEVHDGSELAQWTRDPAADTGLPAHIGAFDQRIYLYAVPDDVYTLDLQILYNGATADSSTSDVQDPPTMDTMVSKLPVELNEAIVAYLVGRWFQDIGERGIAAGELENFRLELETHGQDPGDPSRSKRSYNIIGG